MNGAAPYSVLAPVYDWLVPDGLLEPAGAAAAFAGVADALKPGARVLDCAAGTGQLAVGLALRGFEVVASDASSAMIERARELADRHGVSLPTVTCAWQELPRTGLGQFDAVFCAGNSLTHAVGRAGRRGALRAMGDVLRPGGLLAVTSRNWEFLRAAGSRLEMRDRLVVRAGRAGVVVQAWHIAERWEDRHHVDVAVGLLDDGGRLAVHAERLEFWPFRVGELEDDLRSSALPPATCTYEPDAERYLVTARRAPTAG